MRAKKIIYSCACLLFFISLGFFSYCLAAQAVKKELRPGEVWKDPYLGMEFVWAPGGCYEMGCGSWTSDCEDHEKPVHTVCVDGFWVGKYEVTQGQWRRLMGNNPSYYKDCGDNCPVEQVSWNEAVDFAERLSRKTGHTFRLPTEAEWEYACRSGGRQEKYSGGDNVSAVAWYIIGNAVDRTSPVGSKRSNGLGIYDMSGNVSEWCFDWYGSDNWYRSDYYGKSPRDNPQGPSSGSARVFRGGSWASIPMDMRCASRSTNYPVVRYRNLGFRLVRVGQK